MIKTFENYSIESNIADDYYSAFLSIEFIDEDARLEYDDVVEILKESNISYGIKENLIKEICADSKDIYNILIAEGIPHENGRDAELKYHIEVDSKPEPKLNEDGSVDFKEMSFIKTVKPGEILVEKIVATTGKHGTTISGKEIKGRDGKDIKLKRGDNTVLLEEDTILAAEAEGLVKLINGRVTIVRVIEVRVVGPETGNIYFSGDVHVKEHILDGYTVNCDGDLIVGGVVEGATLKVKGNLSVGKGIVGHDKSDIVVNGNLVTKFIESATIYVKGEINTGEIINSSVLCDSQIIVKGNKGLIIGGEITSRYVIEAKRIGSKLGVITSINLGVDASAIKELKYLKEVVQELKIVEGKLDLMIPVLATKVDENPDDVMIKGKLKQYKDSLHSTRLDLEAKNKRLEEILEAVKKAKKGQLKINSIYPDTVVKIGTSSYFIDQALKDCIITRSNDKVIAMGF